MPTDLVHTQQFRVRYSETDQLGTFYNARALEWFELGRTELLRAAGLTYAAMERRGCCLPLVEAHVNYRGRARYDDLLEMTSRLSRAGKARVRFDVEIVHAGAEAPTQPQARPSAEPGAFAGPGAPAEVGRPVASGWTVHAITDAGGKPMRCPAWLSELFGSEE